jgi:hypothetical protein
MRLDQQLDESGDIMRTSVALLKWCVSLAVLMAGGILSGPLSAATQLPPGTPLIVQDSNLAVKVQLVSGLSAIFESDLALSTPSNGLGDFFDNYTAGLRYSIVDLGTFAAGTELIFRLKVNDTQTSTIRNYFSGAASRNPDNLPHSTVIQLTNNDITAIESGLVNIPGLIAQAPGTYLRAPAGMASLVGFEDSFNYSADNDFNDLMILGYNLGPTNPVPEASIYALFLAGIGVVGLMARRRRA